MMWLNAAAQTVAQNNNPNPSIMFDHQEPQQSDLVTAPENNKDDLSTRCAEMSRLIDELKGKPQRRNIAIKRYELECKGASLDYDRYYNEGISR